MSKSSGDNSSSQNGTKPARLSPTEASVEDNRREYFRVKDRALLELHQLSNEDESSHSTDELETIFADSPASNLINQLAQVDKQNKTLLQLIGQKQPEIANYLKGVDKKIDLIAHFLSFSSDIDIDQYLTTLDYGEGGMSFNADGAYEVDSLLAAKVTFLPNFTILKAFIKVLDCQTQENGKYCKVSCEFHQLTDGQRQLIAQQVLKVQQTERRTKPDLTKKN